MTIKMIKTYNPKYIEGETYIVRPQVGIKLVEDGHAIIVDACEAIPEKITK